MVNRGSVMFGGVANPRNRSDAYVQQGMSVHVRVGSK